jgi:hypothetical protein
MESSHGMQLSMNDTENQAVAVEHVRLCIPLICVGNQICMNSSLTAEDNKVSGYVRLCYMWLLGDFMSCFSIGNTPAVAVELWEVLIICNM